MTHKLCPWCLDEEAEYDADLGCIICLGCGAAGPPGGSELNCWELWDERECEC